MGGSSDGSSQGSVGSSQDFFRNLLILGIFGSTQVLMALRMDLPQIPPWIPLSSSSVSRCPQTTPVQQRDPSDSPSTGSPTSLFPDVPKERKILTSSSDSPSTISTDESTNSAINQALQPDTRESNDLGSGLIDKSLRNCGFRRRTNL